MCAGLAGCSSGGSHAAKLSDTTTAGRAAALRRPGPTPADEVKQCGHFGASHNLEYFGIDGLAAGANAKTIVAELRVKRLPTAPWDSVSVDELVYSCQFKQPPSHKTRCASGTVVTGQGVLRLFVDSTGRSAPNLLDQRKYC